MSNLRFYHWLNIDAFNFEFRKEYLIHHNQDRVFVNGQKWQIENKKCPSYNINGWYWYNGPNEIFNCLEDRIFNELTGMLCGDIVKCRKYSCLSDAEADLAQVLWKIGKPLIIQLTPTGFEMV